MRATRRCQRRWCRAFFEKWKDSQLRWHGHGAHTMARRRPTTSLYAIAIFSRDDPTLNIRTHGSAHKSLRSFILCNNLPGFFSYLGFGSAFVFIFILANVYSSKIGLFLMHVSLGRKTLIHVASKDGMDPTHLVWYALMTRGWQFRTLIQFHFWKNISSHVQYKDISRYSKCVLHAHLQLHQAHTIHQGW